MKNLADLLGVKDNASGIPPELLEEYSNLVMGTALLRRLKENNDPLAEEFERHVEDFMSVTAGGTAPNDPTIMEVIKFVLKAQSAKAKYLTPTGSPNVVEAAEKLHELFELLGKMKNDSKRPDAGQDAV